MRPELELIQRIEQYLNGELTPEDKTAFEAQLAIDPSLHEAVQLQQDIRSGLERASLINFIRYSKRQYYRRIWYRWGGFGLGLAIVALVATFFTIKHQHRFTIVPGVQV